MRCGYADSSWEFWVLILVFMSFLCSSLMRLFVVQGFSFFGTVCGYLRNFDLFIVVPFINSAGLAIIAEADLRCDEFLSKKIRHKLVVSTGFWSWLLNVCSVLTSSNYTATIFLRFLKRCGNAKGSSEY